MKLRTTLSASCCLAALAVLGHTATASADSGYVTILLDQTGSMTEVDTVGGPTRWAASISAARNWITQRRDALSLGDTEYYSVWTYKDGDGQFGTAHIWPVNAASCGDTARFVSAGGMSFCSVSDTSEYDVLVGTEGVGAGVLDAIRDGDASIPGSGVPHGDWFTPLAGSLCQLMQMLSTSGLSEPKWILFESDSGENDSYGLNSCYGPGSELAPTAWTYTTDATTEWGFTLDAWQPRVLRKLLRYRSTTIDSATATPLDTTTKAAVDTKLADYGVNWQVDVHYMTYPETSGSGSGSGSSYMMLGGGPVTDSQMASIYASAMKMTTVTAASAPGVTATATAAAAATTYSTSIPASDLSLFRTLGTSTPESGCRELTQLPGAVYGKDHVLPADVDDSGCTDWADYYIITQQDVWLQRAVLPLEIAVRADISRDGWVDYADLDLLFDNWGQGCQNPPGAAPYPDACFDGVKSASETAIDCGGICTACGNGAACAIARDCTSKVCTSSVCQAPTCTDGVKNGQELDVDCGGPTCAPCASPFTGKVTKYQDWGTGYCANLSLTNAANKATTSWTVKLDTARTTISSFWGGNKTGNTGVITVTPSTSNRVIAARATNPSVGFCANRPAGNRTATAVVTQATAKY
jgi:hypothetical protein